MLKSKKSVPKFETMQNKINQFQKNRGWDTEPSDIAKSVVIEAAELLEHFQWDASEQLDPIKYKRTLQNKNLQEIGFEVADVVWYLINLCERMGIDLVESLEAKYEHNSKKYPLDMFKNNIGNDLYWKRKKEYRAKKGKLNTAQ